MKNLVIKLYSAFCLFFLRLRGAKIPLSSYIGGKRKIKKAKYLKVGKGTRIHSGAKFLCYDSNFDQKLNPEIKIGNDVYINDDCLIIATDKVTIEDHASFGHRVELITDNHGLDVEVASYLENPIISKPVTIQEGAWLGNNVIVLPGVTIGKKAVIGAGSIVTHDIPPYSIAVGSPAKVIKRYDEGKKAWVEAK